MGERIQFTAADRNQGVRARDLGTVRKIADNNALTVQLDKEKTVELDPSKARHIEHGYAVDGTKAVYAERVLVSIDGAAQILKQNPLYRAIARASQNTTVYASDPASVHAKEAAETSRSETVGRLVPDKAKDHSPNKAELERLSTPASQDASEKQQLRIGHSLGL